MLEAPVLDTVPQVRAEQEESESILLKLKASQSLCVLLLVYLGTDMLLIRLMSASMCSELSDLCGQSCVLCAWRLTTLIQLTQHKPWFHRVPILFYSRIYTSKCLLIWTALEQTLKVANCCWLLTLFLRQKWSPKLKNFHPLLLCLVLFRLCHFSASGHLFKLNISD